MSVFLFANMAYHFKWFKRTFCEQFTRKENFYQRALIKKRQAI